MDDVKLIRALKALAHTVRFRMIQEIASAGELSCGQVGERFDLRQPTVSHHLKILAEARLLLVRREGQHGIIAVNHELLQDIAALLPRRLRNRRRGSQSQQEPVDERRSVRAVR